MRLLARRLTREWEDDPEITPAAREAAHDAIYQALALLFEREGAGALGEDFPEIAGRAMSEPWDVLQTIGEQRRLAAIDEEVDRLLANALMEMPDRLRRRMLLAYLGFPFYDVVTLPLLRNEGLTEFDPIKVDRISPDDAESIRSGGAAATLRGIEFYHFGAFFSRAYRENDYLWGRLHGAERMIDLVCSTVDHAPDVATCRSLKRAAFLAILDEEQERLRADPGLLERLRAEVEERLG